MKTFLELSRVPRDKHAVREEKLGIMQRGARVTHRNLKFLRL